MAFKTVLGGNYINILWGLGAPNLRICLVCNTWNVHTPTPLGYPRHPRQAKQLPLTKAQIGAFVRDLANSFVNAFVI